MKDLENQINTKDEMNVDEAKMKKKFHIAKNILMGFETIIIVGVIVSLIATLGIGVIIYMTGFEEVTDESEFEMVEEENFIISIGKEIKEMNGHDFFMAKDEKGQIIESIIWIAIFVLNAVCSILVLDTLRKICAESEKNETPFCEANTKNITKIEKLITILFIFGIDYFRPGLTSLIIVWVVSEMFKLGYKLQIQADETL